MERITALPLDRGLYDAAQTRIWLAPPGDERRVRWRTDGNRRVAQTLIGFEANMIYTAVVVLLILWFRYFVCRGPL